MKVKYFDILNSIDTFKKILEKELPIKTSIEISKLIKKLEEEIEIFNENLKRIEEKYVPKDENGNVIYIDEEKGTYRPTDPEKRMKEINELYELEVEIPIEKIKIKIDDNFKISPKDIMLLREFIDFDI